jgi:hypothetical protein
MPQRKPSYRITDSTVQISSWTLEVVELNPPRSQEPRIEEVLGIIRELLAHDRVILLPQAMDRYGAPSNSVYDGKSLVNSIGDCAAVSLTQLTSGSPGTDLHPILVGTKEAVQIVCSYAERLPPQRLIYESLPLRTYYWNFSPLWQEKPDEEQINLMTRIRYGGVPWQAKHREAVKDLLTQIEGDAQLLVIFEIGRILGRMHSLNFLHGDAHLGNWGIDMQGQVLVNDVQGPALYCPPTPAQCATDILPLLNDISYDGWQAFKLAYLNFWRGGRRVIDLIEVGDTVGWGEALMMSDYPLAVQRLDLQIGQPDEGNEPKLRIMWLANRAQALSMIAEYNKALKDCSAAIDLSRVEDRGLAPALMYLQAHIHVKANDPEAAVKVLISTLRCDDITDRSRGLVVELLDQLNDGDQGIGQELQHSIVLRFD